jgi:hypothetical protein
MIDNKTKEIIVSQYFEREIKIKPFLKRYRNKEIPNLDDVRFGFARVNTRGYIKWIPWKKLTKKQKQLHNSDLIGAMMAFPLMRRLDYAGIARKIFTIEPMTQGVGGYYEAS